MAEHNANKPSQSLRAIRREMWATGIDELKHSKGVGDTNTFVRIHA